MESDNNNNIDFLEDNGAAINVDYGQKEAFAEFFEYFDSDLSTWLASEEIENLKIFKREIEPSTTLCMRNICLFPGVPPDVAFVCVSDRRVR